MKTRKNFRLTLGLLALGLLEFVFAQGASAWLGAASGSHHTVAIADDGTVWASGLNHAGGLGDGSKVNASLPVQSLGLSEVVSVAAGSNRSLALKRDGTVWTYGLSVVGPALPDRTVPMQISGIADVKGIAAGVEHSLALKNDGTVWGWGNNNSGQLANIVVAFGVEINETPSQIAGLSDVVNIAAGDYHSLAVKNDGTVWAWGDNTKGQVGDVSTYQEMPDPDPNGVPVKFGIKVPGLSGVVQVDGGSEHSMALKDDGTVWCWGDNSRGQLGSVGIAKSVTPLKVEGLSSVTFIAAGAAHCLALKNDGTVWAWGYNVYGALGDGSNLDSSSPIRVFGLENIVRVSAGGDVSLAFDSNGAIWIWGASRWGQLGAGNLLYEPSPKLIEQTFHELKSAGAGYRHWFKVTQQTGSRYSRAGAYGDNARGQRGDGESLIPDPYWQAHRVLNLNYVSRVAGGDSHSIALSNDGTVWTFGGNEKGQLGDGSHTGSDIPVSASGLSGVSSIAAGRWHNLVIKSGGVWGWGDNTNGQLGNGTLQSSNVPMPITGLDGVAMVSAGEGHSLALKEDGTVYQWGAGVLTPTKVDGLFCIVAVAAGENHSLALKRDGSVYTWLANTMAPVKIEALSDMKRIAAGRAHSMALKVDGSVWTWGANNRGQLGDSTSDERFSPALVSLPYPVDEVFAGGDSSYAVVLKHASPYNTYLWSDVYGWGDSSHQQIGPGARFFQSHPLQFGVTNYSAPDLSAPSAKTGVVGRLAAFKVIGSDMDGNNLTYSAEGLPASATLDPETGAVAMVPTSADLGTRTVTLKVTDDGLPEPITVSAPLTLSVVSLNRAPVLTPVAPMSVYVGSRVTFKVTATDPDGDAVTLSASGLPSGARFDPATGVFTWVPAEAALAFNGGVFAPRFWAADNGVPVKSTSARFTINVLAFNYAPVIAPIPPLTVKAGTKVVFKFSATDRNAADLVTLSAAGLPSGARFYQEINTLIWTPTAAQATVNGGLYKFRLNATDNNVQPKTASVLVPVTVTP